MHAVYTNAKVRDLRFLPHSNYAFLLHRCRLLCKKWALKRAATIHLKRLHFSITVEYVLSTKQQLLLLQYLQQQIY